MFSFLVVAVAVHILLLSAVVDIYFVSPLQKNLTPHNSGGIPPAKRVVLFVADGLRSASFYGNHMETYAPHLKKIINETGSWGVAHTQVPTESRPGHVAILAGFNEDPSAVTKGWKSNPVNFDSVINQSVNAWCWGSPDIVHMFNKDQSLHVRSHSYGAEWQDFSGKLNTSRLDEWVFNSVLEFVLLQNRKECSDFCEDGNILFLHLLGLDTAGHAFKPLSKQYIANIRTVDRGVRQTELLFETFFKDNQTAYIFTSDHGMTDWGSHGDGSAHETKVPFIIWGAGVANNRMQQDVEQYNIASLIASLIGINIPLNSVGVVPDYYLNVTKRQRAKIVYANLLQLGEQFLQKQNDIKNNTLSWTFQPFNKLTASELLDNITLVEEMIEFLDYRRAVFLTKEMMRLCKQGLRYYQNYFQDTVLLLITSGFVGWMLYLISSIKDLGTNPYKSCKELMEGRHCKSVRVIMIMLALSTITTLVVAYTLPSKYLVYTLFPIMIWSLVAWNYNDLLVSFKFLSSVTLRQFLWAVLKYFFGVKILVYSFYDPSHLTALFIIYGAAAYRVRPTKRSFKWVAGFLLGFGPVLLQLQTDVTFHKEMPCIALWFCYLRHLRYRFPLSVDDRLIHVQMFLLMLAFLNKYLVALTIAGGYGVFLSQQIISWGLLILSLFVPLFGSTYVKNRVVISIITLMIPYTLLASGYESMFMFLFCRHMMRWLKTEFKQRTFRSQSARDLYFYRTDSLRGRYRTHTDHETLRRCFYLLSFIMLSYFGVGNTAAMNSFDPTWVRCFVTVFSPYTMAILILIKLTIPFLVVMVAFRGIMLVTKAQVRNTFLILLVFCDLMVIHLFYHVKNEGSWLDIGVSLSRFVTLNVTTIILLVLYQIAYFLTTVRIPLKYFEQDLPDEYLFPVENHFA